LTAVGVLILVVAASVYAERMAIARGEPDLLGQRAIGLGIAAFGLVGALLIYRRPGHRLGWLLTGIGVLALLGASANEYVLAVTRAGASASDLVVWLVWLSNWFWWPVVGGVFVLLPLLFPDGRPPTARWRWVAVLGVVAILGLVLSSAVQERYEATILGEIPSIENPLEIEGLTNVEVSVLFDISALTLLAAFVGAVASMTVRFRRSQGVERLQLKWFSYAVGLMLAWTLVGEILWVNVLGHDDLLGGSVLPFGLLLTFIPITIAVAILRYRLYAIDRIISRTVGYGLVTAVLIAAYVGAVLVLRRLLPAQGGLAVAGSTLAVAALFNPLRRRLQTSVDRRFNRSRYDAVQVVDAFVARLRSDTGIDDLARDLLHTASAAMQPGSVSLWLRETPS
jgi:hypothetical protein